VAGSAQTLKAAFWRSVLATISVAAGFQTPTGLGERGAILPYYVANLNIEAPYATLTGKYEEYPNLDAALEARAALAITGADDIEAVMIEADPAGHADQFDGSTAKRRPTQVVEAQFAQPFLVATALVQGKVGIAEVDGLGDAAVLALSDRIAGMTREGRPSRSLSITVRRSDGRSITVEATDPIGLPQKPLSDAQFEAKFRDCARNAVRPLSDASVDTVLAAIERLETLADVRELLAPFAA
jgi:2-methylcitrate dehydratase PrpD